MRRALVVLLLCLPGCGANVSFDAPLYAHVEVWNRTLDPIFLIDQEGRRLDVAACGYAQIPMFRVSQYQVFTHAGPWFAGQEGGTGAPPGRRWVIVARPFDMLQDVPANDPEPSLPACQGHAIAHP